MHYLLWKLLWPLLQLWSRTRFLTVAGTQCQVGVCSMSRWVMGPYIKPWNCESFSVLPRPWLFGYYICVLHESRGFRTPPPVSRHLHMTYLIGTRAVTLKHIFTQKLRNAMAISLNASPFRVWTTFSCLLWEVTFSSHPDYLEAFPEMHLKSLALFWNPVR